MKKGLLTALGIFVGVSTALMPILCLAAVKLGVFSKFLPAACLIFLLQCVLSARRKSQFKFSLFTGLAGLGLGVLALAIGEDRLFFWYPVLINLALLTAFSLSLRYGTPVIERLARKFSKDFPPEAAIYTRKLTGWWCVFFVINGLLAMGTVVWGNIGVWTLWNGCLSYVCIFLFLSGEYIYRKRTIEKGKEQKQNLPNSPNG